MRYSKLNPAKAQTIVAEAFAGGVMTSNADNGYNPTWNESFSFTITESWSACLIIRLWDRDDEETDVAHYSAMVENLQPGFRIIPLYQQALHRVPMANILVHVTKNKTGMIPGGGGTIGRTPAPSSSGSSTPQLSTPKATKSRRKDIGSTDLSDSTASRS